LQKEICSWEINYRRGTFLAVSGFVVSIALMFCGWYGWLNYFLDKPEIWFQRSGSIMTAILFISDYNVYKLSADIVRMDMIPNSAIKVKDKYKPFIKPLQYLAVSLTIFSTFIWGYGDLMYLEFKKL
jgi:hypothetical protein